MELRNLVIPGIGGILLACAIFSAFVIAPWTSPMSNVNFPQLPPGWPSGPLDVKVVISNLTEPLGVGSEGDVTIIVTSTKDASDVTVTMEVVSPSDPPLWPLGITVVEGNLSTCVGDLKANVSVIFNARIRAVEAGYARMWITVTWYPYESFHFEATDSIWILIQENNIQISYEPITPPGFIEAQPFNGTLPVWPNGTAWEP